MPFDFKEFQAKCDGMSTEELQKEMENYTRQLSGGATSTAASLLLAPYTGGVSLVALGLAAPKVHNARKKREIIEAGLKARGTTHNTRKRDVIAPMAVTGAINGVTMGLAGPIAGTVAGQVVGHGVEYATSHIALDAGGSLIEHKHEKHQKLKAEAKLQAQYGNFKIQYANEQAVMQGFPYPVAGYQPGLQIPGLIQGYQPSSPQTPTGVNLPGPPPLQLQGPPQHHKYEPVTIPASYNTKPQQVVTQQQSSFHAGAAFQFQAKQSSSNKETNVLAQQAQQTYIHAGAALHLQALQSSTYQQTNGEARPVGSQQPQHTYSSNRFGTSTGYPADRPLITSSASSATQGQTVPPPRQHRPSLPTPAITSHTPIHRPSLPNNSSNGIAPQAPTSSTSGEHKTLAQTETMRSMEEELTFLRIKVVAMELERRGEPVKITVEEIQDEEDGEDNDDENPKSPEIPETFPIETWAPEPSRRTTQDSNTVISPAVESSNASSSPKLNVFVDLQQPKPQHIVKSSQEPQISQIGPHPTFSTPQPEKQLYPTPIPQFPAAPMAPAVKQESSKSGLSIAGGISITYNRDSAHSQNSSATLVPNAVHRPASVPPQHTQFSTMSLPSPAPQQQPIPYQTYNPQQHTPSVPTSPQQQASNQGVMIPYRPVPASQHSNTSLQTYNANQQATAPSIQYQQQTYPQPAKQPPPLQHQDSGYYSNPSSRHSSTFSISANASLNMNHSQQNVASSTNAQSPGSQQQYISVNHSPYGQMPTTFTPSPISPSAQQYFPPPSPGNVPPPRSKDYFGPNNGPRISNPNPQVQGYQPALPAPPGLNYGNVHNGHNYQASPQPAPVYGGQQGSGNSGWQWGNANAGAPGEPNYGAPPPIPEKWRGS